MISTSGASTKNAILIATSNGITSEYPVSPLMLKDFDNVVSLDFENQKLISGQPFLRSATLVSMRVILTLLIEGVIFFALGYREKRSWITFLIINLLTQGALNIALNIALNTAFMDGFMFLMMSFLLYEFLILAFEIAFFTAFISEKGKMKTALYVVVANFCSLILGGYLISNFPI